MRKPDYIIDEREFAYRWTLRDAELGVPSVTLHLA